MSDQPLRVLFLCNHNSARSQMAEAFLRHLSGGSIQAYSAGLGKKDIKPTVFEVMEESGIPLEGHVSKTVDEVRDLQPFDYVIVVCKTNENECPGFTDLAHHHLSWEIESPFPDRKPADLNPSEKLTHYRSLRDQVSDCVARWLEGINRSNLSSAAAASRD
ncbi:MAG: arsenate reductase ArsC [Verrucomicrobiales bacterium]|nr:arsenate reductase ArsC [Verrucomicrobiales bacterium]